MIFKRRMLYVRVEAGTFVEQDSFLCHTLIMWCKLFTFNN